jgi:prephenate dehydrogenase
MSSHPTATEPLPGRIAIVGLGLIGGSIARELARLPEPPRVTGWCTDPDDARAAEAAGVLAAPVTTREKALVGAELVVLAAPLGACLDTLSDVAKEAPPGATVTDSVSLKARLEARAAECGLAERWVGAHPMAGGERGGFRSSSPRLFQGALTWIVPARASNEAVGRVERLWTAVGAHTREIDAAEHDRLMALVSHLPQLTANALASVLAEASVGPDHLGPGGRDMTRLAASSPSMWTDLLSAAPPDLVAGLRTLAGRLGELADAVEVGDTGLIRDRMEETRRWGSGG